MDKDCFESKGYRCLSSVALHSGFRWMMVVIMALFIQARGVASTLHVYLPSDLKARSVQQEINAQCPSFDSTVFSRSKEFWSAHTQQRPTAIITSSTVFDYIENYQTVVEGVTNNRVSQPYLLVSVGDVELRQDPNFLNAKRIGILNMLGRRKTREHAQDILRANVSVKGVSKPRDLMPLLNFQMVDMLLVAKPRLEYLEERSDQRFSYIELSSTHYSVLGAIHEGVDSGFRSALINCVDQLGDRGYNTTYFGVEGWKR